MLQKELYRKHMMDEQERRKKELLEQVLARRAAAETAKRYTLAEGEETEADLLAAEAAAEAEAKEAAASASKEAAAPEDAPKDFIKVKQEIDEKDMEIEEMKVLSSLRWCHRCQSKSYLRQGLCTNLLCPLFLLWVWQMHHSVFVQGGQYMKGPSGALQAGRKI
jgi:hypothetical protein